ncbi:MAG: ATP-binding SpoIIE family protein phosphatase [Opitutales bacterium]
MATPDTQLLPAALKRFLEPLDGEAGLLPFLDRLDLDAGSLLFREGAVSDALFFVVAGRLRIFIETTGGEGVTLRICEPGEAVGEMGLYRREKRGATVEALEPVRLFALTGKALRRMETDAPLVAAAVHRFIVELLIARLEHSNREVKAPINTLARALVGYTPLADTEKKTTPDPWSIQPVRTVAEQRGDEVGALARAFLDMDDRLGAQIRQFREEVKARERVEGMLRVAGQIQESMLPSPWGGVLSDPRVSLDLFNRTAYQAGGDLYSYALLADDRLFFAIGDVSDKGVAAALFMAGTMTCLSSGSALFDRPADILAHANRVLCENNRNCMFVTLFAGILNCRTGELTYANAGHDPGLVSRGGRDWMPLPVQSGLPLGVEPEFRYENQDLSLAPGDRLFLYTDGATDRLDAEGKPFGLERLRRLLDQEKNGLEMAAVGRAIESFGQADHLEDDITLLRVLFHGDGTAAATSFDGERQVRVFDLAPALDAVSKLGTELAELGVACNWPEAVQHDLTLCLEEVVVNTIEHGFGAGKRAVPIKGQPAVQIQILALPDRIESRIIDCGPPFNPLVQARHPDLGGDLEKRPIGGLGVYVVRQLMDDLRYRRQRGRNHLLLVKRLP